MTRIKICGLTNLEDAQAAFAYGADLLGFIGVSQSPRYLNTEQHWELCDALSPFAKRVIVVNTPEEADEYGHDFIQHYADSSYLDCESAKEWRIRAFRVRNTESLEEVGNYHTPAAALLLDAYHETKLGGSGETFNWDLAIEAKKLTDRPLILAGGLTPENVADALESVRPFAVDVSSGVESSTGIKDHGKIKAFINAVRQWDFKQS